MPVRQAPPGAVPYVSISQYSDLHVAVYTEALERSEEAYSAGDVSRFSKTHELVSVVMNKHDASEDAIIQAIEELRADATLLMLPNHGLAYCSYDSH